MRLSAPEKVALLAVIFAPFLLSGVKASARTNGSIGICRAIQVGNNGENGNGTETAIKRIPGAEVSSIVGTERR